MRSAVIIAALTTIGVIGAVPISASAIPNSDFFAAPDGTGSVCSPADPCSLHTAIVAAGNYLGGSPTVVLVDGTYQNVSLAIDEPMTLAASDSAAPVLEGNGSDPVLTVNAALNGISGITVTGGSDGLYVPNTGSVGDITDSSFNDNANDGIDDVAGSGAMTLDGVTADGNSASGLALSGLDSVSITDSTFSNNGVDGLTAGDLNNGQTVLANANNSTFFGNEHNGIAAVNEGHVSLSYSSVIDNGEHGLYTDNDGVVLFGADILAGNGAGSPEQNCANGQSQPSPQVTDAGYNIVDDATCPIGAKSKQVDPATFGNTLQPLDNYGGPTKTVAITDDSAAAGFVTAAPSSLADLCSGSGPASAHEDQRGLIRPQDPCAAGAFDPGAATIDSTTTLTANPASGAVHGDPVTLTATISGGVGGASGGTVEFDSQASGGSPDAPIDGCDSQPVVDGLATCQFTPAPNLNQFDATFSGNQTYNGSSAASITSYLVKYYTTTQVVVNSATQVTATIVSDPAGNQVPTGNVTFLVNGANEGSVPVVSGTSATATLAPNPPLSGQSTIVAQYAGDGYYAPSSDSVSTTNPNIKAKLSSGAPKTRFGWYRKPVTVTFTCIKGSSDLVGACPGPVTLKASKAKQSVVRSIRAVDGGTATVKAGPINIDRVKPSVRITGIKPGHTYPAGTTVHPKCAAKDTLSGLAGNCKLAVSHKAKGTVKVYTAVATAKDKAGNVRKGGPYHWDIKTAKQARTRGHRGTALG